MRCEDLFYANTTRYDKLAKEEIDTDYRVCEIEDRLQKRDITNDVLRALPDWFGINDAIVEYVQKSQAMMFWAAYVADRPVGFLSLPQHSAYTSEIYCMGLHQEFHHRGIGMVLVQTCEAYCQEHSLEFLTVKTLDESRPDDAYAKTRRFYIARGVRPLEVSPTLWGDRNPCLFMAKCLSHAGSHPLSTTMLTTRPEDQA